MRKSLLWVAAVLLCTCVTPAERASAGDVKVKLSQGVIYVQGSPAGDKVGVESTAEAIQIYALDVDTTVNGGESVSFRTRVKLGMAINMGGGEDLCHCERLDCTSISIIDGPATDKSRDDIQLKDVSVSKVLSVDCGMGTDVVTLAACAGSEIILKTGSENDVAALFDLDAAKITVALGDGDDFALAGEIFSLSATFDGGADTWTRGDIFDRLAGDVMIHMDFFETSNYNVLASSFQFENRLSFVDDVMDTPLEETIEAMAASLGY